MSMNEVAKQVEEPVPLVDTCVKDEGEAEPTNGKGNVNEAAVDTNGKVDVNEAEAFVPVDDYKLPTVVLPEVTIPTLEEDEEELVKVRAKLYRFEQGANDDRPEWKERGLGDVKLLRNRESQVVRVLMRRDKTLKVCANHLITHCMKLNNHSNTGKAFVWTAVGDISDGSPHDETLCIRFGKEDSANQFKHAFVSAIVAAAQRADLCDKIKSMFIKETKVDSDDSSEDEGEDTGDEESEEEEKSQAKEGESKELNVKEKEKEKVDIDIKAEESKPNDL